MKLIIALRGKGNTGKSTTIKHLFQLMLSSGFSEVDGNYGRFNDFWSVLIKSEKKVGLTSLGDSYRALKPKIDKLKSAKCKVIVCACRSEGQTIELLENQNGFYVEYIEKTIESSKSKQSQSNFADAQEIFKRIKGKLDELT